MDILFRRRSVLFIITLYLILIASNIIKHYLFVYFILKCPNTGAESCKVFFSYNTNIIAIKFVIKELFWNRINIIQMINGSYKMTIILENIALSVKCKKKASYFQ